MLYLPKPRASKGARSGGGAAAVARTAVTRVSRRLGMVTRVTMVLTCHQCCH